MRINITICSVVFLALLTSCSAGRKKTNLIENRLPVIYPNYSELIIPVNIAPMNFIIQEEAQGYNIYFSGSNNKGFAVNSNNGIVTIPIKKWKKLLLANIGDSIEVNIAVKKQNKWVAFRSFKNFVSADSLDAYIVYRRINSALMLWKNMAIVQRSTETFEESAILENKNTEGNCMHCHSFQNHNPENMSLHLRTPPGGTFIKSNGIVRWLDTKTPYTLASFAYPAWHPKKNMIAYSTNKIHQVFYITGDRLNNVFDEASDIVVYDVDKNLAFTSPKIAGKNLENLPNWSPDGKTLYYINCPAERFEVQGKFLKYDLMCIPFNPETHEWGQPDTLLSAEKTGMSITFPEASPDGRFIVFCMADFGYFTIGNTSSDLYILDLQDRSYRKLDINSNQVESFHNWSLNSRWLVFASKREDGIITLPYFSHIDSNGKESKPFVLPVKDPESLITRLFNYNRPVFVNGKVNINQQDILSTVYKPTEKVRFDTLHVAIDSLTGIKTSTDQNESSIYRKN